MFDFRSGTIMVREFLYVKTIKETNVGIQMNIL